MSGWRIVVRTLDALGGAATASQVGAAAGLGTASAGTALKRAAAHGLLRSPTCGGPGGGAGPWVLTERGVDWCEGRITMVVPRGGYRAGPGFWRPTWVSSLPRGIRLGQEVRT